MDISLNNNNICLKNNRKVYIDFIRIVAMFLVIVNHTCGWVPAANDKSFWLCNFLLSITRPAVPMFAMLTGMLLLDESKNITNEKIFKRYIPRMVSIYLVWSIINGIYRVILLALQNDVASTKAMVDEFFYVLLSNKTAYWYLLMLIGFYLLLPILRLWVKKENKMQIKYFLIISFIAAIFIPTIVNILKNIGKVDVSNVAAFINNFHLEFVMGYLSYFILGWYIKNFEPSKNKKVILIFIGLIGFGLMYFMQYLELDIAKVYSSTMYSQTSIWVYMYAIGLFILLKEIGLRIKEKYFYLITNLGKMTFGLYLIHIMLISLLGILFPIKDYFSSCLFLIFTVFVVGLMITFVLNKIPGIKKLVQ